MIIEVLAIAISLEANRFEVLFTCLGIWMDDTGMPLCNSIAKAISYHNYKRDPSMCSSLHARSLHGKSANDRMILCEYNLISPKCQT